jgi:NADPH-dependent glutamate synthase beta subunit-like oxidoreductase/NAD(P)H-flavin reductase
MQTQQLNLQYNLSFSDLYDNNGLIKIDKYFCEFLEQEDVQLKDRLIFARTNPLMPKEESILIIEIAPYIEKFIAYLFNIENYVNKISNYHKSLDVIFKVKKQYIQRHVAKKYKPEDISNINIDILTKELEILLGEKITEHAFAKNVLTWFEEKSDNLNKADSYAAYMLYNDSDGVLFRQPKKTDIHNLLDLDYIDEKLTAKHLKQRDGFKLQDEGCDINYALDQANYCIFCHNQGKDSCSKGLKSEDNFKVNDLGTNLVGCPLEEKISEMNMLKSKGMLFAPIATAIIDNPMVGATGHRICNDCMKSCIYQKQEPVNIPQIETRSLKDMLELPWGFEIYSLLTKWNPLNVKNYLPKPDSGYKILVVGTGPAGFTLSHYLLNMGHVVVAVDGLKIEHIEDDFKPVYDVNNLYENLDDRVIYGFGGVAEYGITVRWNKNFLKIIRLMLERRKNFALYGGVRFGSNITYNQAIDLGFDHISLAIGAGKPTLLDIPNSMARGVRTASDFLMALQLTGAFKKDSIANLQIRLPLIVIGGGLTAIDAATESLAYYQLQVEKFLTRIEKLNIKIEDIYKDEELEIAQEYIEHALELRKTNDKIAYLRSIGGVTILYRKNMQNSPAYKLNHEEVELAMEQGIYFAENIVPVRFNIDEYNHVCEVVSECGQFIKAKSILIAAGTKPNTVLAREDSNHFFTAGTYFKAIDEQGNEVTPEKIAKPKDVYIFNSINENKAVSFLGDAHPSFVGNVVKAMASAKNSYPIIDKFIRKTPAELQDNFLDKINYQFKAYIESVAYLAPAIIEVIVKAPMAVNNFQAGQFYRLQNFDCNAHFVNNTKLLMEGIALTGAWVDKEKGLISLIVLEMGGSSNLCAYLKCGEEVVLMGPTGTATEILKDKTIILVGGGLGNAVLFSIGKALRANGCKVIYFAGYRNIHDRYKTEEIEQAADKIIWCCDEAKLNITREGDKSIHGNIIDAMRTYKEGIKDASRMIVIGSDKMMQAVSYSVRNELKEQFANDLEVVASINSPMQCMMKEICAQCLQKHIDPLTQKEYYVYSCYNQDQNADTVCFSNLNDRLKQNNVQEKLTALWIKKCLKILDQKES